MTIHANGKKNSGLLATGQLGDAVKHELKGLNLERKVDEVIFGNDQVNKSFTHKNHSYSLVSDDDICPVQGLRLSYLRICPRTGGCGIQEDRNLHHRS